MTTTPDYTISKVREAGKGLVAFELVWRDMQRYTVTMPRKQTTPELIDATIRHAVAAVTAPLKPLL